MKVLYIDCSMGAAGDMLSAALFELLPENERGAFIEKLNSLGIPGVRYIAEPSEKCGITGTHMSVLVNGEEEDCGCGHHHEHHEHEHGHEHHHSSMHDIEHIVQGHMKLPTMVALDIMSVYEEIAEAESHVHGKPVDQIHFHEVGSMDAVADITAVCLLMNKLKPAEVVVSPIHVGSGQVKCAHGILPVPAPATAYILNGIPTYGGEIKGELCTPTGAALLKHFATSFGSQPLMKASAIGYGMGKKDFPQANCVRVMIGETIEEAGTGAFGEGSSASVSAASAGTGSSCGGSENQIVELSCNIDDMSGEAIGFAMDRLFEAGANEVYTVPCGMKKSRPGVLLRVLCKPEAKEKMVSLLFKHTTTIGIRELLYSRYTLDRRIETVDTPFGPARKKISSGYGVIREKFEYEDLARIAKENDLSIEDVKKQIE